jgi:GTP:adenosylcobinamide-phosphate guanylyltransferase
MDDFVISNLQESKNEWCSRLVSIFTPLVIEGFRSIFNESWKMCIDNDEVNKYLMTFQNLLSRVPKWNSVIVEEERRRIIERSGCNYLEDLISCVHIIQLKVLTCIRVGNKQKKIDISIPKLDHFIHKVYIHSARKIYTNVYLFEKNISPLQVQKNNRELEVIIQECILTSIRESIPTEAIIRAYMDENIEHEEEVTIENVEDPVLEKSDESLKNDELVESVRKEQSVSEEVPPSVVPSIQNIDNEPVITRLSFNDFDSVLDESNKVENINAPKTIERLEEISTSRAIQRKLEEEESDDEDRIKIHTEPIVLSGFDILDMDMDKANSAKLTDDLPILDFEELP